eukprot:13232297-Alexandrium_andersonii.AAC.1
MRVQRDCQRRTRILAWRLAMREPHSSMHAFATDVWPSSDTIERTRCGVSFSAQGKYSALSA